MDRTSIGRPRFIDDSPAMRPNVALVASDAPNATLGALDAPNATLGRIARPLPTELRATNLDVDAVREDVAHQGAQAFGLRLGLDPRPVHVDRLHAGAQPMGDRLAGHSVDDEPQHLALPLREPAEPPQDVLPLGVRSEPATGLGLLLLHDFEDLLRLVRLLEEVHRTAGEGPHRHRDVAVRGAEDDRRGVPATGQLLLQPEPAQA